MPLASTSLPMAGFVAAGSWVPVSVSCVLVMPLSPPDARRTSLVRDRVRDAQVAALSAVVAEDEVGHAARLPFTLDLVGQSPHDLDAVRTKRLRLRKFDVRAVPAAGCQHGRK